MAKEGKDRPNEIVKIGKLFVSPAGVLLAFICFFLPWAKVSCVRVNAGFGPYDATDDMLGGILWMALAVSIVLLTAYGFALVRFVASREFDDSRAILAVIVIVGSALGLLAIIIRYFQLLDEYKDYLDSVEVTVMYGAVGTVVGLLVALVFSTFMQWWRNWPVERNVAPYVIACMIGPLICGIFLIFWFSDQADVWGLLIVCAVLLLSLLLHLLWFRDIANGIKDLNGGSRPNWVRDSLLGLMTLNLYTLRCCYKYPKHIVDIQKQQKKEVTDVSGLCLLFAFVPFGVWVSFALIQAELNKLDGPKSYGRRNAKRTTGVWRHESHDERDEDEWGWITDK